MPPKNTPFLRSPYAENLPINTSSIYRFEPGTVAVRMVCAPEKPRLPDCLHHPYHWPPCGPRSLTELAAVSMLDSLFTSLALSQAQAEYQSLFLLLGQSGL